MLRICANNPTSSSRCSFSPPSQDHPLYLVTTTGQETDEKPWALICQGTWLSYTSSLELMSFKCNTFDKTKGEPCNFFQWDSSDGTWTPSNSSNGESYPELSPLPPPLQHQPPCLGKSAGKQDATRCAFARHITAANAWHIAGLAEAALLLNIMWRVEHLAQTHFLVRPPYHLLWLLLPPPLLQLIFPQQQCLNSLLLHHLCLHPLQFPL